MLERAAPKGRVLAQPAGRAEGPGGLGAGSACRSHRSHRAACAAHTGSVCLSVCACVCVCAGSSAGTVR